MEYSTREEKPGNQVTPARRTEPTSAVAEQSRKGTPGFQAGPPLSPTQPEPTELPRRSSFVLPVATRQSRGVQTGGDKQRL